MGEGAWAQGKMVAACKELGFDYVHDTNFGADLTIMEEGTELVQRVLGQSHNNTLPQFTSCCPGWVKFVEMYYPDLIDNLSSARSPMSMQGSVLKTYWAKKKGVNPEDVVSVALMPCTAKKFEASRPEFDGAARYYEEYENTKYEGMKDIDYVLSVRELARMIKAAGINFTSLDNETQYDNIMGEGSGAGLIFGNTGGVMEAALRSAYYLIEGENPPDAFFTLKAVRDEDLDGYIDVATVNFPSLGDVSVAVVNGLHAARTMCEQVRAGKSNYAFLEVMTCPGGCIAGGGQPRTKVPPDNTLRYNRINTMYAYDEAMSKKHRLSHLNSEVNALYKEFITEGPCSELAELLNHTTYTDRSASLNPIDTKNYEDRFLVGGDF
jgi:iron-only hydrogenase group A